MALREPQIDPTSDRVEEIPDTELPREEPPPRELSDAAREASARLDAVIARVGLRDVGGDDADAPPVSLESLDAAELRQWFADVGQFREVPRDADLDADLESARRLAAGESAPPSTEQERALRDLAAEAPGPIRVRWNGRQGVPWKIEGALAVTRGADSASVAATYLDAALPTLQRLLESDERDVLEPVTSSGDDEASLDSIVFARYRDGLRVLTNHVEIFVTRPAHPWGGGVVARVRVQWDREVEPGDAGPFISEDAAVALAQDALGRTLERWDARLLVRCASFRRGPRLCRPTWDVRDTGGTGREPRRPEIVQLHARTGEVLKLSRTPREATGTIDVNSHWPYDTADVDRDFVYAELQSGFASSSTNSIGGYNFSPPFTTAVTNLRTNGWPTIELIHQQGGGCPMSEVSRTRGFTLGGASTVNYGVNATFSGRTEALMFQWLVYLSNTLAAHFPLEAELADTVWFDAEPGLNPQMHPCGGVAEVGSVVIDGVNDMGGPVEREFLAEEFQLTVQWCTEELGAGCTFTDDPETDFSGPWNEGMGHMIAGWFSQYETQARGLGLPRTMPYQGPGATGDVFLHDEEFGGTMPDSDGCAPTVLAYDCSSTEACWFDEDSAPSYAHDVPRCMPRTPSAATLGITLPPSDALFAGQYQAAAQAWCRSQYPSLPAFLVDAQRYGQDPTTENIMICLHNNYPNAAVFANLGAQLFHTAGYRDGLRGMFGADRDRPDGVDLTQGSVNFHERFAGYSGDYEASDAFHTISTESFGWLDDVTDTRQQAEVLRTPRNAALTFTHGGSTGAPLGFQSSTDLDQFLLFGDRGASYRFRATSLTGSPDLCVKAYDWITGLVLATAAGCTDGTSLRDVDMTVTMPTERRVSFRVQNTLGTTGTYSIELSAVGDEYPGLAADAATAQPLGPGGSATFTFNTSTDVDLFRYDVPLGDTGDLTFSVSGSGIGPTLFVYQALDESMPGTLVAWHSINVTVVAPEPGYRYYVAAVRRTNGGYGPFTITASQADCTWQCNETGTFTSPRYLPSDVGGSAWNAIDQPNTGSTYGTWAMCNNGTACDWYRVDLAEGERLTATLSKVFDSLCDLELAVFAPASQQWWTYTAPGSGTAVAPIVTDVNGSMEGFGAQLTFVARSAGTYRLRVRGTSTWNCPGYELTATHGAGDTYVSLPIH